MREMRNRPCSDSQGLPNTGKTYRLEVDGVNVTGSVTVPQTGGWQSWTTVTTEPVTLTAGRHILTFVTESNGFNLNYYEAIQQ